MSEQIAHLATFDDCRRLALTVDEDVLCPEVKQVLADYQLAARMGSLSRGNADNIIPGVLKARDHWNERDGDGGLEREFAYILGWWTHRATDRHFKPIFREVDPEYKRFDDTTNRLIYPRVDGGAPKKLSKVYHDAVLFQEIYTQEPEPFPPGMFEVSMGSHPGSTVIDVGRTESLFQFKWMVELLGCYECVTNTNGTLDETAIRRILSERQTPDYLTRWYEEAYYDPDPHHLDRFINEPEFYLADDPIIELTRQIQRGEHPSVNLRAVLAEPGDSQYAACLAKAYVYLQTASDLFVGAIDTGDAAAVAGMSWKADEDIVPHETVESTPRVLDDLSLAWVAAVDDGCRLAVVDTDLSEQTHEVLSTDPSAVHAGAIGTPGQWMVDMLAAARSRFAFRRPHAIERIAFAAGVLGYDGARLILGTDQDHRQAVTILTARSARTSSDFASADQATISALIEGYLPRIRQRWHTLRADADNFVPWVDRFLDWADAQPDRAEALGTACATTQPLDETFYDPTDPVIQLARSTRDGRLVSTPPLAEAVDGNDRCTFAKAIVTVYGHIRTVDAYVDGRIDEPMFVDRIDSTPPASVIG